MSRRFGGVIAVRLLVVLCAIALPIYFLILFGISPYKIHQFPFQIYPILEGAPIYQIIIQLLQFGLQSSLVDTLINYVVAPIFFSLPWVLFIYLNRTRLANTFSAMNSSTTIIPLRYRIFYGFNTLIVILFFLLPMISPILGVVGGIILAGRIVTKSEWVWKRSSGARILFGALLVLMICPLPIYAAYIFYNGQVFFLMANWIWSIWTNIMVMVYAIAMCIVDALAIGSVIWLIFAGAGEFEANTYGVKMTEVPYRLLAVFQMAVFLVLAYFTLPYVYFPGISPSGYLTWGGSPGLLFDYINWICLGIFGVVTLIGLIKGIQKGLGLNPSIIGFIFAGAFIAVDYFTGKFIIQLATIPQYISWYLYTLPSLVAKYVPYQYWFNLYIPLNEIQQIFIYFFVDTGNPAFLGIVYQVWYLVSTNSIITLIAIVGLSVFWFLAFVWSFARSPSKQVSF
ncbi:MAG: hypothetical protein WED07_11735 [Candidatus Freyarchaeum deiterrae]